MSERFERGRSILETLDAGAIGELVAGLQEIAPGFARYLVELPFGDIHARPGLDLRSRQIATVAALTALGTAAPQLQAHIGGALNAGCSRTEIVEVIIQMAVYAGFPAALNGLAAARAAFAAREPAAT